MNAFRGQSKNLSGEESSECERNTNGPDEQHNDAKDSIAHVTLVVATQRKVRNQHIRAIVEGLARENTKHHSGSHREKDVQYKKRDANAPTNAKLISKHKSPRATKIECHCTQLGSICMRPSLEQYTRQTDYFNFHTKHMHLKKALTCSGG